MDPEQVVRRLFDAFLRKDLDDLVATLDPDVTWTYIGANPKPGKAVLRGRDRVRRFFEGIYRRLEMSRFEPEAYVTRAATVVVFGSESGTVRSTGEPFRNEWAQKYVVEAGTIREVVEYNVQTEPPAL